MSVSKETTTSPPKRRFRLQFSADLNKKDLQPGETIVCDLLIISFPLIHLKNISDNIIRSVINNNIPNQFV